MKKLIQYLAGLLGYQIIRVQHESNKNTNIFLDEGTFQIEFKSALIDGRKYFVPSYALHRPAVKCVLKGEMSEPETHTMVELLGLHRAGSIVHAGTFFGDMLPNFSKFTQGRVYAFEPVLENYVLAKLCVEQNDLTNVVIINSALSDSIANLKINTVQGNGIHAGGSSTISNSGHMCTSLKIDNLEADDIVLIQLDVEGHELQALSGALETIKRCRPVIAIEDNEKACDSFLTDIDYQFVKKIPGLKIWAPIEDNSITNIIKPL